MMNQMQHDFVGSTVAPRDYGPLLGTPFRVFLSGEGVNQLIDALTGKTVTEIVDLPGLIAAIVRSRVLDPRRLSSADLKYVRSALRLKSKVVAEALDLTPEHYSRCESGSKLMSPDKEKHYRMWAYLMSFLGSKSIRTALAGGPTKAAGLKAHSPEEAAKTVNAFSKIFLEMKLETVYEAGDELAFHFSRGRPVKHDDNGDEDGKWQGEEDRDAA